MFKFRGGFEKLELNVKRVSEALRRTIQTEVRLAAREFVRAAVPKVPVYTGEALASLRPLGRLVRESIPISPVARHDRTAEGEAQGQGQFAFDDRGFSSILHARIDVVHYYINEMFSSHDRGYYKGKPLPGMLNLRHPTPWGSFQAGRAAFKAYLRANLKKKVPRVTKFITRTRVAFDE